MSSYTPPTDAATAGPPVSSWLIPPVYVLSASRLIPLATDDPLAETLPAMVAEERLAETGFGPPCKIAGDIVVYSAERQTDMTQKYAHVVTWSPTSWCWSVAIARHDGELAEVLAALQAYLLLAAIDDMRDDMESVTR